MTKPGSYRSAVGKRASGDDRVGYRLIEGLGAFYLADGATGVGLGGEAADAWVAAVDDADNESFQSVDACVALLRLADEEVSVKLKGNGDTTGILVVTDGVRLWGASAGDSRGVLYKRDGSHEVTGHQARRPRFGSGAVPRSFSGLVNGGEVLLLASDGLWDFASHRRIAEIVRSDVASSEKIALLESAVREQNEERLPDDLSMVLLEFKASTITA